MEPRNSTRKRKSAVTSSIDYYRMDVAAEVLKCSTSELLTLGATGKAEIMAPVLNAARFEWQNGIFKPKLSFTYQEALYQTDFGPSDRIVLFQSDVAHIEAVGWAVPTRIIAPGKVEAAQASGEAISIGKNIGHFERSGGGKVYFRRPDGRVFEWSRSVELMELIRTLYRCTPWHMVGVVSADAQRTTVDHLFLSAVEIQRLAGRSSRPLSSLLSSDVPAPRKPHGNSIRNREKRELFYEAAIAIQKAFPGRCKTKRAWASEVHDHSANFWKVRADGSGAPALRTMEDWLREALADPSRALKLNGAE